MLDNGTGGNLTTDAHLAALGIEYNGVLYTADNDFKRFARLNGLTLLRNNKNVIDQETRILLMLGSHQNFYKNMKQIVN